MAYNYSDIIKTVRELRREIQIFTIKAIEIINWKHIVHYLRTLEDQLQILNNLISNTIPSPGLYAQTGTSTPITNTTVETSLINGGVGFLTVPANTFKVGDSFICFFSGTLSSSNNQNIRIKIKTDSIILADTGLITLPTTTNKDWELHVNFTIRALGGPGVGVIKTAGRFFYNKNSNNNPENVGFKNLNNTTFDTTINNTLEVTAKWSNALVANSIYTDIFNLYKIY
jgi:hypothetical protein